MIKYQITLSKYVLKSFGAWNGIVGAVLAFVASLFNLIDLMRRAQQSHADIKFSQIFKASFLQLPSILDQLSPLIVLFSTMILLWNLHKRSEITVMRSLGYSVWSLVGPMVLAVAGYSIVYFSFLNPLSASLKEEYTYYQDQIFQKHTDLSSVSKSGLWLKHQYSDENYAIVQVEKLIDRRTFGNTVIYDFNQQGQFIKRYDVERVVIQPDRWLLERPTLTESNDIQIPTEAIVWDIRLTLEKIQQTFQNPSSISFWKLPKFINLIEKTGLSSTEHTLYFMNLLVKPFVLISMVLIGGVCAFVSLRQQNAFIFILSGIFSGFSLHFLNQIFYALGESLKIPLFFAALTPTFIGLLVGLVLLIHLEEG